MGIQSLKLYHAASTRSSRVRWLLLEIGRDAHFEIERISLHDAQHRTGAFAEIGPNRAVPVLEITWQQNLCTHMMESAAMITFLADAFPSKGLAPQPGAAPERADYLQMVHLASTTMDSLLWQLRLHERLLPEPDRDKRTIARNREAFSATLEPYLESRLMRHTYIGGAMFSAADCLIGHNVLWARRHGLCQSDAFNRYLRTLSARPACIEAFDDASNMRADLLVAGGCDV